MSHQKEREEAMNYDHPPLLEKLAAEYVLGTMGTRVRRRFTRHLQNSFAAQRAVANWHQQLMPLHQAIAPIEPQAGLWQAIARRTRPTAPTIAWAERLRHLFAGSMKPALGLCFGALLTLGLVHQAPQIIVSVEHDAIQVECLALEPVRRRPYVDHTGQHREIVLLGKHPHPQAPVFVKGQQMIDRGVTLALPGTVAIRRVIHAA